MVKLEYIWIVGTEPTAQFRSKTNVFKELVDFPILEPNTPEEAIRDYKKAQYYNGPDMVVERKSYYDGKTTTI